MFHVTGLILLTRSRPFLLFLQKKNLIAALARRQATPTPMPTPIPIVALLERPLKGEDEVLGAAVLDVVVEAVVALLVGVLVVDDEAAEVVAGLD